MAFNFNEYTHFMGNSKNINRDKAERILVEDYLLNKDFAGALFDPADNENISEAVAQMYKVTSKPKAMKLLIDAVSDYGPEKFERWVGTYIFSVASFNLDVANRAAEDVESQYDDGKLNKREARSQNENIDKFMELTGKLNKLAGKIVKSEAKIISKKSGLDKDFVKYALKTNPDPKYINSNRIGFYMNQLLTELYTELDEDNCAVEVNDIDWKYFFRAIYGKDNVLDCATFILLEGAHRSKSFKTERVKRIWEALTDYALDQLETSDAPARNQMIELYLKRIEKMFANGAFDLRVDLRSLPEKMYPHLSDTIKTYADRFARAFATKTTKNA